MSATQPEGTTATEAPGEPVVGWKNMQAQVDILKDQGAHPCRCLEGSDDKQIADIDDLFAGGKCSVLIVSPNTTAALTPAVEKACKFARHRFRSRR